METFLLLGLSPKLTIKQLTYNHLRNKGSSNNNETSISITAPNDASLGLHIETSVFLLNLVHPFHIKGPGMMPSLPMMSNE